jgi:hypothetical protein
MVTLSRVEANSEGPLFQAHSKGQHIQALVQTKLAWYFISPMIHAPESPIHELCKMPISYMDGDNSTLNLTKDSTTNALALALSAVNPMLRAIIPNLLPTNGPGGDRAYVRACAAQAPAIASTAAKDAAVVDTTHSMLLEKHCMMFLQRAFGINSDGMPIQDKTLLLEQLKKYKSVKRTVAQYQEMIWCLSNWGDDDFCESTPEIILKPSKYTGFGSKINRDTTTQVTSIWRIWNLWTDPPRNYTRFAWAGGIFFPVVLLCQFFVLAGNRFWLYILLCT